MLDFGSDATGSSLPWIRHMIEENVWIIQNAAGDDTRLFATDKEVPDGALKHPVLLDIKRVELGWLKIAGGRDFIPWPGNSKDAIARPADMVTDRDGNEKFAYGRAYQVFMYSTQNFIIDGTELPPMRVWSSSGAGHKETIQRIYQAAEKCPEWADDSLAPAVQFGAAKFTRELGGPTKIHEFEIVGWQAKPEMLLNAEFPGNRPAAAQPVPQSQPQQAQIPSPAPAADAVSDGDFSQVVI